jgi:tetratricopeptide (TPR) repeat protein
VTKLLLIPVVIFVAFVIRRIVRRQRIILGQLAAYRRGDYAEQLRIVETLKGSRADLPVYLFFRGKALYEMGELAQAEESLREGLPVQPNLVFAALTEEALGETLLEQGKYAEAISVFESSLRRSPGRGGPDRLIAETILRQGGLAADALRRGRAAVASDEAARTRPEESADVNLAESLAVLAWAVAVYSGEEADVKVHLARAFELCPESTKPVRAGLHYHAGCAYAALGDTAGAAAEFERAATIDPNGNFGRLGRSASTQAPGQSQT